MEVHHWSPVGLNHLKESSADSWEKIEDLMESSGIFSSYPRCKLRSLLMKAAKGATTLTLHEGVGLDFASPLLEKRHHLEECEFPPNSSLSSTLINATVIELEQYRRSFSKTYSDVAKWISPLGKTDALFSYVFI